MRRRAWLMAAALLVGCGDDGNPGGTGATGATFEPVEGIGGQDAAGDAAPNRPDATRDDVRETVDAAEPTEDAPMDTAPLADQAGGGADAAAPPDAGALDDTAPPDDAAPTDALQPPEDAPAGVDVPPPPVGSPGDPGPFATKLQDGVSIETYDGRKVEATLCLPSADGGATVAPGPFPLVIVSPGYQQDRSQYLSACKHLSTWGFLVVLQTYAGSALLPDHAAIAKDVSKIIDWAGGAKSGLAERWDGAVGTAGHSMGGKISLLTAALDPRIGAVAAWDPVDSNMPSVAPEKMAAIQAPLLLMGETLDNAALIGCAPADQNYHQYFEAAQPPALEVTVIGADHMDWVDDQNCIACLLCKKGSADHAEVKALTRRTTAAFLLTHLQVNPWMEPWLTGTAMQADAAAGRLTFQQK